MQTNAQGLLRFGSVMPVVPGRDVTALLHECPQGEPERVEDPKLIGVFWGVLLLLLVLPIGLGLCLGLGVAYEREGE